MTDPIYDDEVEQMRAALADLEGLVPRYTPEDEANLQERVRRLPAQRPDPERQTTLSADPSLRVCVHQIARALEEFARKEYVPIFGTTADFETAAIAIAEKAVAEQCPLKR